MAIEWFDPEDAPAEQKAKWISRRGVEGFDGARQVVWSRRVARGGVA